MEPLWRQTAFCSQPARVISSVSSEVFLTVKFIIVPGRAESSGFKGTIEAPRAGVTVAPFADYRGCIHANELHIDADAEVRGHNLSPVIISGIACESDADCGDNGHCEAGVCKAPVARGFDESLVKIAPRKGIDSQPR